MKPWNWPPPYDVISAGFVAGIVFGLTLLVGWILQ